MTTITSRQIVYRLKTRVWSDIDQRYTWYNVIAPCHDTDTLKDLISRASQGGELQPGNEIMLETTIVTERPFNDKRFENLSNLYRYLGMTPERNLTEA